MYVKVYVHVCKDMWVYVGKLGICLGRVNGDEDADEDEYEEEDGK